MLLTEKFRLSLTLLYQYVFSRHYQGFITAGNLGFRWIRPPGGGDMWIWETVSISFPIGMSDILISHLPHSLDIEIWKENVIETSSDACATDFDRLVACITWGELKISQWSWGSTGDAPIAEVHRSYVFPPYWIEYLIEQQQYWCCCCCTV